MFIKDYPWGRREDVIFVPAAVSGSVKDLPWEEKQKEISINN